MKTYIILVIGIIFSSCTKGNLEPTPQFNIFNLKNSKNLKFEHYYTYDDGLVDRLVEELDLIIIEDISIGAKKYAAFAYSNDSDKHFDFDDDNVLDFNFLPIRYENGNYYEFRGNKFKGNKELVILKDNIHLADTWTGEIDYESTIGLVSETYHFEVVNYFPTYNEFGVEYKDVYKIKETVESTWGDRTISYHYYNYHDGIIRREIPSYLNGTYGAIAFNRLK